MNKANNGRSNSMQMDSYLEDIDFGPGMGAVSSNGGVLICGGENNVMKGPDDISGGKVSMANFAHSYVHFSGEIITMFNLTTAKILPM